MKKNIIIIALLFLGGSILQAQSKKERKLSKKQRTEIAYNQTKELVESGQYEYIARFAVPVGNDFIKLSKFFVGAENTFQGNSINLRSTPNYVKIDNNNLDMFMPYFGEVNRVINHRNSVEGNSISYDGLIEEGNVNVTFDDSKKVIKMNILLNKTQEQIKMDFVIQADGYTNLTINSSNKRVIRYRGTLRPLKSSKELASN